MKVKRGKSHNEVCGYVVVSGTDGRWHATKRRSTLKPIRKGEGVSYVCGAAVGVADTKVTFGVPDCPDCARRVKKGGGRAVALQSVMPTAKLIGQDVAITKMKRLIELFWSCA